MRHLDFEFSYMNSKNELSVWFGIRNITGFLLKDIRICLTPEAKDFEVLR